MSDEAPRGFEIDAEHELAELDVLLGAYERLASEEALARARPEVSGWSVGRHVAHVAIATAFSLRNVLEIADGGGRHTRSGGALGDAARSVIESGRIPRGATAPIAVDVRDEPDASRVSKGLELGRANWKRLCARSTELSRSTLRIEHPTLGPLDELEWLRFARIHAEHHLAIVAEITAG